MDFSKKPTVFISYTHADSKFVDSLAEKLKNSGVDVWIDKWEIKIGESITQKINEGIGASDFFIVVLSQASVNSKWVAEELSAATIRNIEEEKHAFILPILLEDCEIPPLLKDKKYADFKANPGQAFLELLEVIRPPSRQAIHKIMVEIKLDPEELRKYYIREYYYRVVKEYSRPVRALFLVRLHSLRPSYIVDPESLMDHIKEIILYRVVPELEGVDKTLWPPPEIYSLLGTAVNKYVETLPAD